MKKFNLMLVGLFLLLCSLGVHAQTSTTDYFTGKWSVLLKGTPNGDSKMIFVLEMKDSTITGVIQDTTGTQISKIDKAEVSGNSATLYFNVQGYDVNLVMSKKDEDHITGSLMGMFDAVGDRVKSTK